VAPSSPHPGASGDKNHGDEVSVTFTFEWDD
jgi:hypothetical protein